MDCQVIEVYEEKPIIRASGWRSLLAKALYSLRPSYPKLDLEVMSDHMKRDLGFMDWRDSREDSDMTR